MSGMPLHGGLPYRCHAGSHLYPTGGEIRTLQLHVAVGKGDSVIRKVVCAIAAAIFISLAVSDLAAAQSTAAEQLRGFVRNEQDVDGKTVRDPVANVKINVFDSSGAPIGTAVTDDKGAYQLDLPGPGDFRVKIDTSTLPEGIALRDPAQEDILVNVRPSEIQILQYNLGKDTRKQESKWDLLPQTIANGFKFGLIIAICAIGLSLIYGTTGLSNFAHGELVTLGAIVAWWMNQKFNLHLLIAAPIGIAAAAAAAGLMEGRVFGPMRRKGIGLTSAMIVSIGIGISLRYVYIFLFGGRSRAYADFAVQKAIDLGPISLTPRDLTNMAICLLTLVGIGLFLQRTRAGKAVRAVSDNPALSSATGINTDRVIMLVWLIGGGLAGLGGILLATDQQVRWDSGFSLLLLMFAAITLGGLGSPYGALVGSLVIGMMVELWTWVFSSVIELKTMGALIALIVLLLVRPQGLLGRKERIG
jgi:neutral amino acid transport system permease protein